MDASKKKPCGNMAQSKSVQLHGQNESKDTTTKQPTKAEVGIEAFLRRGSLNTFEANREYNDTCLHSFVSFLYKRFGLNFTRKFEDVGAKRPVKRYTPTDIAEMKRVLNNLRVARGVGGVK
jgi:hypothetical protein